MADALAAFLDAASTALHVLERPELAERWRQDSVLPQLGAAALAGHLVRGMTTVEQYLDGPEPAGAGFSAARYFHTVIRSADINDPAHQAIRDRGAEAAAGGPAALAGDAGAALGRLSSRLAGVGAGRRLRVAGGLVMTLDEYLRTRVVELVIHADDLAASLGSGAGAAAAGHVLGRDRRAGRGGQDPARGHGGPAGAGPAGARPGAGPARPVTPPRGTGQNGRAHAGSDGGGCHGGGYWRACLS